MPDYAQILSRRWPGSLWELNANDFSTLVWMSDGQPPTQAELDAAAQEVEVEIATEMVYEERREAYTSESDPLFFEWQRGEGTEQAWLDKVAEIKQRYPLPE